MKSFKLILTALAVVAVSACTAEIENVIDNPSTEQSEGVYMEFDASMSPGTDTKATIVSGQDSEGKATYEVKWHVGDEISLFYGSGSNGGSKFTSNATEQTTTTKFTGYIDVVTGAGEDTQDDVSFWAVYPYNEANSCDGNSVTFVIPSEQTAVAEGVAPNTLPVIAQSSGLLLSFYQACAYFKFTVTQTGIEKVAFTNATDDDIAGTVTCTFGDNGKPELTGYVIGSRTVTVSAPDGGTFEVGKNYYAVLAPVDMEDGMIVTYMKSDEQATYEITRSVSMQRGVVNKLTGRDANLDWMPRDYFLTFSMESGSNSVSLNNIGGNQPDLEFSFDKIIWRKWNYQDILFRAGHPVYIRGNNTSGFSQSEEQYSTFVFDNPGASVDGSVMSLLTYQNIQDEVDIEYCFYSLFENAPIVKAPELPATSLSDNCYEYMFSGCTSLEEAPELPSENLYHMCYAYMFSGCTSLVKAPVLPAEEITRDCYCCMFESCTNLNYVEAYFTKWTVDCKSWTDCTNNWLSGVAETGTFIRSGEAEWNIVRGPSGIPAGWNVIDDFEISLDKDILIIPDGGFAQLTATTNPAGSEVIFESSNNDIVTVSNTGWVYSHQAGEATITATSHGKSATCSVKVFAEKVQFWEGGPYWYGCNLGASTPEQSGKYFYWGGLDGYHMTDIHWWCTDDLQVHSFDSDNYSTDLLNQNTALTAAQDAADNSSVAIGSFMKQRIPSVYDYEALCKHTTQEYIENYFGTGVSGILVKNSKGSVFFPYAGRAEGSDLVMSDNNRPILEYWTRDVYETVDHNVSQSYVFIGTGTNVCYKYYGLPIRPVSYVSN